MLTMDELPRIYQDRTNKKKYKGKVTIYFTHFENENLSTIKIYLFLKLFWLFKHLGKNIICVKILSLIDQFVTSNNLYSIISTENTVFVKLSIYNICIYLSWIYLWKLNWINSCMVTMIHFWYIYIWKFKRNDCVFF